MKPFRRRFLGALLFALLSFGQAYPFSVAWASAGSHKTCCCSAMKDGEAGCHCQHGGKMKCHKETTPGFSPAPCGAPSDVQSLNFSGELCLPRFAAFSFLHETSDFAPVERLLRLSSSDVPESPPPRNA